MVSVTITLEIFKLQYHVYCALFDSLCKLLLLLLISLFAHIGYNPIEQHNILTIHVNYIKNNILEKTKKQKTKKNKYIITAKQVKKVLLLHYILYLME